MKIISPKEIYNENWRDLFYSELCGPTPAAFNAESCLLAALHELKIFDLDSARQDIKTAISFIQQVREAIPPMPRPKPVLVIKEKKHASKNA
jgi:hypothetical protein